MSTRAGPDRGASHPTPTLARVAAAGGVSVATVSKVLNGRPDVGPSTRARVLGLLAEQGYHRRGRRSQPTPAAPPATVELVLHGHVSSYFAAILPGVIEVAADAGVSISVSLRPRPRTGVDLPESDVWVDRLIRLGRTAVIDVVDDLHHGDLAALRRSGLPLVAIDPLQVPDTPITSVGVANFSGGYAATQHLIGLAHRQIAYLGATPGAAYNQAREFGFRAAMDATGLDVPDRYVRHGDDRYLAALARAAALLEEPEPPTAIFAATDEIAAGVYEAARVGGLRIPDDLSVVGFDDTDIARLLSPPLTTVRQPLREMGRVALRTALRLAVGEQPDSDRVELATELVIRYSTAPPGSV